jgi:hypothetical protein
MKLLVRDGAEERLEGFAARLGFEAAGADALDQRREGGLGGPQMTSGEGQA